MILAAAAPTVRPGGRLVYAICTVARGENERVVQRLPARPADTSGLRTTRVHLPELARPRGRRRHAAMSPDVGGLDGFFAVARPSAAGADTVAARVQLSARRHHRGTGKAYQPGVAARAAGALVSPRDRRTPAPRRDHASCVPATASSMSPPRSTSLGAGHLMPCPSRAIASTVARSRRRSAPRTTSDRLRRHA